MVVTQDLSDPARNPWLASVSNRRMVSIRAALYVLALMQTVPQPGGQLSLLLGCGGRAGDLLLTLGNAGDTDIAVLVGRTLDNGRWHLPRELVIELGRTGSAEIERLVFRGPTQVAGSMDHWVVELPAQATFTLTIHSADFVTTASTLPAGAADTLKVRLTGRAITYDLNPDMAGMQRWRLWLGDAESNPLRLSDCARPNG